MASKDVMAAYVMKLLELDDSKQRATLDCLSKYADSKGPGPRRSGAGTQPQVATEPSMEARAAFAAPPGLELQTPWGQRPPIKIEAPDLISRDWGPDLKAATACGQAGGAEQHAAQHAVGSLVASLQKLLAAAGPAGGGGAAAGPRGQTQELELLRQHLEKEQEASIQRLSQLLRAEQSRVAMLAGATQWATGAGQLWGMGLGGQPQGHCGGSEAAKPQWGAHSFAFAPTVAGAWAGAGAPQVAASMGPRPPTSATAYTGGLRRHAAASPTEATPSGPPAVPPTAKKPRELLSKKAAHRLMGFPAPALLEEYRSVVAPPTTGETLRMHLTMLLEVESDRVIVIRKINQLGFASATLLEDYGSHFGTVERVLVAHSRVKFGRPRPEGPCATVQGRDYRLRPASMGFVVMGSKEEAEAMLKNGREQRVGGAFIQVQPFERRMSDISGDEDTEDQSPDANSSEDSGPQEAHLA